jgi:hypothetical protein
VVYPVFKIEEKTNESQRYNCTIRNGGNAIPQHASPEAKGSNPTTGLTLLWVRNPFRGNFNYWQVSQEQAGQNSRKIKQFPNWQKESRKTFEETSGFVRPERVNKWPNFMRD